MDLKTALIALTLLIFSAFSAYVMYQIGYLGIWQAGVAGLGEMQILADLVISCSLICLWIVVDGRKHGINPWPYLPLILITGSIGALLYLLRRFAPGRQAIARAA